MEIFVIVEMFKGMKVPKIRGVYQNEMRANIVKKDYQFAFIDKQQLIQTQEEKINKKVFVVMELLKLNVPRIIGVFKDNKLAKEIAISRKYKTQVIEQIMI